MKPQKIHEIVGVFNNFDKMEETIAELEVSGFSRTDVSVLGSEHALKKAFGDNIPGTKYLEDNIRTPKSTNIAREELGIAQGVLIGGGLLAGVAAVTIASGGVLAPGIITSLVMGGAAGTAVGGFLAKMLGNKYADFFQKQIDNGGLLLWVRADSEKKEGQATEILKKYGAQDVHVHNME